MAVKTCQIDGCPGSVRARGWCNKHYRRWKRTGDAEAVAWIRGDPEANFWAKVTKTTRTNCWPWTGYVDGHGYGRFVWPGGQLAHQYAYVLTYGPTPSGTDIDHMCHNVDGTCPGGYGCPHRRCVNPNHLRAIPVLANRGDTRPGLRGKARGEQQRAKTHCPRGHVYDAVNTYIDPHGRRNCRACRRKTT
jgi:hypothetical protein